MKNANDSFSVVNPSSPVRSIGLAGARMLLRYGTTAACLSQTSRKSDVARDKHDK